MKQTDKLRGVNDLRELSQITKLNHAPDTRTDEMFDCMGTAKLLSKLNLKMGLYEIRVQEQNIEKTAFKIKFGHFEFIVMPMRPLLPLTF